MSRTREARPEKLSKRFRDEEDIGALLEVLLAALSADSAGGKAHDLLCVERWVLGAAFGYVCHVAGWPMQDLPLPKRGSSGRPRTRFEREMQDYVIHRALRWERDRGNKGDGGLEAVADLFNIDTETVRTANRRAARRLAADPARYRFWDSIRPIVSRFAQPEG